MRDWWRRGLTREIARLRKEGRAAMLWSLRITIAAVASYVVGTLFFPGTQPLLAPLTAMLVVQVTPVSLLASGLDRVVAVVSGVSLAVAFATFVPLEWWSLALLILLCITIGQVLRLRSNRIEVAISGMLVLGVGSLGAESAAWQRLAETLVGAAVGIAANLLFPPKIASGDAGRAIDGLADSLKELLNSAADEIEGVASGDLAAAARAWLGEARAITHEVPQIGAILLHAEQGRRLNVRAVGTPDVGPGLRQGLEALEHASVTIRGMFRAVVDATTDPAWADDDTTAQMWQGLAHAFREMAGGVDAFGQLVHDEAEPARQLSSEDVRALREALDGLHEARARLEDLLTTELPAPLLELHTGVLSAVKRLLREMDLDERMRQQVRLRRPATRRPADRPAPEEPNPDAETQVLPRLSKDRRGKRHP